MPPSTASLPSRKDIKQRTERAFEWKSFRRNFLYSQRHLADALGCSRRTIVSIEGGREVTCPHYDLLRKFRDLKRRLEQEKQARQEKQEVA